MPKPVPTPAPMDNVYELYQNGHPAAWRTATITPPPSRSRAPATSSRTRPRSARRWAARCSAPQRYREAAAEFEAVVEHAPTNDFALFCLGRALQLQGRHEERASRSPWPPACARSAPTTALPGPRAAPRGLALSRPTRPGGGGGEGEDDLEVGSRRIHGAICHYSFRTGPRPVAGRKRALARFFFVREGGEMSSLQADIEARLAEREPDVEVLLAEVLGGRPCGSSSTIPTASPSPSASASPTPCPSSASATRSRSPRRPRAPADQARPLPPLPGRRARVRTARCPGRPHRFTGELVGATDPRSRSPPTPGSSRSPTPTSTDPTSSRSSPCRERSWRP